MDDIVVYADHSNHPLVRLGAVDASTITSAAAEAALQGIAVEEFLLQTNKVNRNDYLEAYGRAGGTALVATKMTDLPEWNVILNEPGQVLGQGGVRDQEMVLLSHSNDKQKRCFVIVVEGVNETKLRDTYTRATMNKHRVACRIFAGHELIKLIYDKWDKLQSEGISSTSESDLHDKFDKIGMMALQLRASDIHISKEVNKAGIAMRIHGELEQIEENTGEYIESLCASIYNTLTEQNSAKEGFKPNKKQDGAIERRFPQGLVRFRYSGLPIAPNGFDVTLRVIPIGVERKKLDLGDLGYSKDQQATMERMFMHSSGLILFAGTTGSGKSTTMANRLEWLAAKRPGKKIRTVEEPVEYKMAGVYQTPVVRSEADPNAFLETLRQILRSDPDVIGVGEIRDIETATLAFQGVRSGHLCVSTLHADGAPACYERLIDMGVDRKGLAQVGLVGGFIYQKLLPVLCADCAIDAESKKDAPSYQALLERVRTVNQDSLDGIFLRNHRGCPKCEYRGVTGRTVCAEILRPTPAMVQAVREGDSNLLWKLWRRQIVKDAPFNMTGRTAFEHALYKMRNGIVSPEAVESEFHYLDEASYEEVEA